MSLSRRLVLVFSRSPHDERRAKPLGPAAPPARVEALHRALLERALDAAAGVDAAVRLVTTGDLDEAARLAAAHVPRSRLQLQAQAEGSFAERLEHAVASAFGDGYAEVVVIGGDTAHLASGHLADAFARLDASPHGAVLGPARDGGYYLLGLGSFTAAAFRDVKMGTPDTLRATRAALVRSGREVALLSALDDVDDLAAVTRLARSGPAALRRLALELLSAATVPSRPHLLRPRRAAPTGCARAPPPSG